jgi:dTMP kinase
MFITFEGIEGSGKTTQISRLKAWFESQDKSVITTKEPGGTALGQTIRQLILDPDTAFTNPHTELLLFYADRLEHITSIIQPALDQGKIVLCDRYIDSTWAYQSGGRQISETIIESLNTMVPLMPDKTILLDISPEEGLKRAKKRAALDRFEQEELSFHHRIRETYLRLAKQCPDRIHLIPVQNKTIEAISQKVISLFDPLP